MDLQLPYYNNSWKLSLDKHVAKPLTFELQKYSVESIFANAFKGHDILYVVKAAQLIKLKSTNKLSAKYYDIMTIRNWTGGGSGIYMYMYLLICLTKSNN